MIKTYSLSKFLVVIFCFSLSFLSPALADPATSTLTTNNKTGPLISNGKQLYGDLRCEYCHRLKGRGGIVGPALDNVGFRRTKEWMADHFQDPKAVSPGTKMANVKLRVSQVRALVAYMNSLGGYSFTPQAAVLFKKHCSNCHSLNQTGAFANDLSQEGRYRDMGFLLDYISDPAKMNAETKMGNYKSILTRAQIKDIAAYLYQQSR